MSVSPDGKTAYVTRHGVTTRVAMRAARKAQNPAKRRRKAAPKRKAAVRRT